MTDVTRFAPSPSGYLHLGHALSALFAARSAGAGGRFLLRIEDIDVGRCRPEYAQAIVEDLAWLGLAWEEPVRRQSAYMADYKAALDKLAGLDLLYPCFCTRKDIEAEMAAAASAPHDLASHALHDIPTGPDGHLYPGTCRALRPKERKDRLAAGEPYALRLKTDVAAAHAGPLVWIERGEGEQPATPEIFGDVVLARKDTPTSYHLAVTVD
ncbi:MAG: glutamate--tRNA ligase family protein, partial [Rhodospirillaceae bacterium]